MYKNQSILALIPARGGSKGLPGKNLMLIDGRPLVSFPITTALNSKYIDNVVLSSDDDKIMAVGRMYNCCVPFQRPEHLASDTASSIDVAIHAIDYYEEQGKIYDYIILLEPTSPLTEAKDVDRAIEMLIDNRDVSDSIVGMAVVESNHPLFLAKKGEQGNVIPYIRKDFITPIRRQDLNELLFFEGSLYMSDIATLKRIRSFVHEKTMPFVVPRWKSIEIDEYSDFLIAELYYNNFIKNNKWRT